MTLPSSSPSSTSMPTSAPTSWPTSTPSQPSKPPTPSQAAAAAPHHSDDYAPHPLVAQARFETGNSQQQSSPFGATGGGQGNAEGFSGPLAAAGELALVGSPPRNSPTPPPGLENQAPPPGLFPTGVTPYSLFPMNQMNQKTESSETPGANDADQAGSSPDFLGRLHHMKTLFRMSATSEEPVSVMVHRVGPLLILDDGPLGWKRGETGSTELTTQLFPPISAAPGKSTRPAGSPRGDQRNAAEPPIDPRDPLWCHEQSQLMLAAMDPVLEAALGPPISPPKTPPPPPPGPAATSTTSDEELAARWQRLQERQEALLKQRREEEEEERRRAGAEGELQREESFEEPEIVLPAIPDGPRLVVKHTFIDVDSTEEGDELGRRTRSAPGSLAASPGRVPRPSPEPMGALPGLEDPQNADQVTSNASSWYNQTPVAAGDWQMIPYEADNVVRKSMAGASGDASLLGWDLLQCRGLGSNSSRITPTALEAVRSLYEGIPPQPSRFGRAVEWCCGPYRMLLGCDLVVFRSDDKGDSKDYASFKMLPPGQSSDPSRSEILDVYLENVMCDITKAVWGSQQGGETTWKVFNTADLPRKINDQDSDFDVGLLQEHGQRILHFLRQQCHKEGGSYWLFREANSTSAEIFDLSSRSEPSLEEEASNWKNSRAFSPSESLAAPLAKLCLQFAKAATNELDQRQLLQKAVHLVEHHKEDNPAIYAMAALQLARSHMRTPVRALPDKNMNSSSTKESQVHPAAGRLSVTLRYLEDVLQLLSKVARPSETETANHELAMLAQLRLEAHVTYSECIVKLVKEACIPTYTAWLSDVQQASQDMQKLGSTTGAESLGDMKKLSAGFLLWRLFWLCRAELALGFLSRDKRETECWNLDRDLCEIIGDTLYGLSRFPSDDARVLLEGKMATAEGICASVQEVLRHWGNNGDHQARQESNRRSQQPQPRQKSKKKRLQSPESSDGGGDDNQPHDLNALFLAGLNPLHRGYGDERLRDEPLLCDASRINLWKKGEALREAMGAYGRATARLRRSKAGRGEKSTTSAEDQAGMKIARKLAHLYNEEARAALLRGDNDSADQAQDLLSQAHEWMLLSQDHSNASRVLLNLSELHAQKATQRKAAEAGSEEEGFSEQQYGLWLKAIECCEEAAALSEGRMGRREAAFNHLRVGVHLSVSIPNQSRLAGSSRRESIAELADKHFSKALRGFGELKEEREVAVCHYHMADLPLQELKVPNAEPLSRARQTAALRHAKRSLEYWEKEGALTYAKDFIASHIRIARLLEASGKTSASAEAIEHLGNAEQQLLALLQAAPSGGVPKETLELITKNEEGKQVAVESFRREMSRACQTGLRSAKDVERLKNLYRRVLRNEPIGGQSDAASAA